MSGISSGKTKKKYIEIFLLQLHSTHMNIEQHDRIRLTC